MKKSLFVLVSILGILSAGCDSREGPAERFGERVDEVTDNIREGEAPLKEKGAAEKFGEAVDEQVEDIKEEVNDK